MKAFAKILHITGVVMVAFLSPVFFTKIVEIPSLETWQSGLAVVLCGAGLATIGKMLSNG